jgi:hypothetical protein
MEIARGLFERSEFHSAHLFQAAQGIPLEAEQVNGCPFFWFAFFGQAKKMNIFKKSNILQNLVENSIID